LKKTKEKKLGKLKKKSNFEKKIEKKREKKQKKRREKLEKNKKKYEKKMGKESMWITVVIHSEMCVGESLPPHHLDYVLIKE
jgi:hypothetical protein